MQHRLRRVIGRRGHFDEDRLTIAAPIDAVQHQAVQVDVQVGGRPKALDQRDRAAVGLSQFVDVVGNTWNPNQQGANATGRQSTPPTFTPVPKQGPANGLNFKIDNVSTLNL